MQGDRYAPATLKFITYSGMTIPLLDRDVEDCRNRAAAKIRKARDEGQPVSILDRGKEWEFETPEDALMISDLDGLLVLTVRTPEDDEIYDCEICDDEEEL